MHKYLLIALDIDGTLLTSDKKISPNNIKYINEVSKRGIHITYCSGRAPAEMKDLIKILPSIRFGVCMSGALVYDFIENRTIYSNSITREYIKKIIEVAKDDDGMIQFLTDTELIVRKEQITHMSDYNVGIYQPMHLKIAKKVKDMNVEAKKYDSIPKVNIYFHSINAQKKLVKKLIIYLFPCLLVKKQL